MKQVVGIVLFTIIIPISVSCSNGDYEVDLVLLGGKDFILEVNRISEQPNVQFPSDQLDESDYKEIINGYEYEISFSVDMQTISIMQDSVSGAIMESTEQYKQYDLDDGLFAGGRLVVWITDGKFEAEYTVYGSGVPIIRSERGYMIPMR